MMLPRRLLPKMMLPPLYALGCGCRMVSMDGEEWFDHYLGQELIVSRPTTLGDAFSLALITEARLDDQAAPVAGTTTKTFGNNGGDESKSSGTGKVHILIDNGSTHNFVQLGVVERMKLPVKNTKLFKVYIGNVETLLCKNLCEQVTLEIQGHIYLFLERLNAKYIKKKKMKAEFQRRIWKPGIKIVSRHHLEGKVVLKECGMLHPGDPRGSDLSPHGKKIMPCKSIP
ncbi:hypothetical protein Tco_0040923 [Tanacetum coccineum]